MNRKGIINTVVMEIENNSHFIRYHNGSNGGCASMCHYREVWKDGFTVETFIINSDKVYYESAGWSGKSPNSFYSRTWIMAKLFNRWVYEINKTKDFLINLGKGAGIATVKELKAGDCVFCTVPPYDPEDEYDNIWYCFLDIVSVDSDYVYYKEIMIDDNDFSYCKEVEKMQKDEEYWLSEALESNGVQLIDRSVFYRAIEIFKPLTTKIISEIKERVERIET